MQASVYNNVSLMWIWLFEILDRQRERERDKIKKGWENGVIDGLDVGCTGTVMQALVYSYLCVLWSQLFEILDRQRETDEITEDEKIEWLMNYGRQLHGRCYDWDGCTGAAM